MIDLTKPDYCNQCYEEPPRMFAVMVRVGDGDPVLRPASEVFETVGKNITKTLKPGFKFVQWIAWGDKCRDEFLRTKRLRNVQGEMVV